MKFNFEKDRDSFAARAFIMAISECGIVKDSLVTKYQTEQGLDVKLLIDGAEYDFAQVFNRFEDHFNKLRAEINDEVDRKAQHKAERLLEDHSGVLVKVLYQMILNPKVVDKLEAALVSD